MKAQPWIKSRNFTTRERHTRYLTTVINVAIPFTHRDSNASQKVPVCNKYGHFSSLCYEKKTLLHYKNNHRNPKAHQLHAGPMYPQDSSNLSHYEDSSSVESFCLQLQVQSNHAEGKQIPNTVHLKTNLAYHSKPHHTWNMYLRAHLDTC